jgi:hypothetical protein
VSVSDGFGNLLHAEIIRAYPKREGLTAEVDRIGPVMKGEAKFVEIAGRRDQFHDFPPVSGILYRKIRRK